MKVRTKNNVYDIQRDTDKESGVLRRLTPQPDRPEHPFRQDEPVVFQSSSWPPRVGLRFEFYHNHEDRGWRWGATSRVVEILEQDVKPGARPIIPEEA